MEFDTEESEVGNADTMFLPDNSIKDDSNCGTACKSHKHKHIDLFIRVDLF